MGLGDPVSSPGLWEGPLARALGSLGSLMESPAHCSYAVCNEAISSAPLTSKSRLAATPVADQPLGVLVHDHIIVGKQGRASFRGLGLI